MMLMLLTARSPAALLHTRRTAVSYIAAACLFLVLGVLWFGSAGASSRSSYAGATHACKPGGTDAPSLLPCSFSRRLLYPARL